MQSLTYNELYFNDTITDVMEPIECFTAEITRESKADKKNMGLLTNACNLHENYEEILEGRISLAFEKLTDIPKAIADRFAAKTKILDLSHNRLQDLSFLLNFRSLNSLILDKNSLLDERTLPYLPNLQLLWLNHCEISNITKWIKRIQSHCPSIKYLSMLGNPGAMSMFNGNTIFEQNDYRLYVIGQLQNLFYLDDSIVTASQKSQARTNRYINSITSAFHFMDRIGGQNRKNSKIERRVDTKKIEIYEFSTSD